MNDEDVRRDLVMVIRQAEMAKAQLETLLFVCVELGKKAGLQIIDASQAQPPGRPTNAKAIPQPPVPPIKPK